MNLDYKFKMINKKYIKFPLFLVLAWISAFIFEEVPRTILRDTLDAPHLWELGSNWFPFFLVWYGIAFLIAYFIFIKRPTKYAIIFGIIFGLLVETFWFKMMENIYSFILFILLYGLMFYFPFEIYKKIYDKKKTKKYNILLGILVMVLTFGFLMLFA